MLFVATAANPWIPNTYGVLSLSLFTIVTVPVRMPGKVGANTILKEVEAPLTSVVAGFAYTVKSEMLPVRLTGAPPGRSSTPGPELVIANTFVSESPCIRSVPPKSVPSAMAGVVSPEVIGVPFPETTMRGFWPAPWTAKVKGFRCASSLARFTTAVRRPLTPGLKMILNDVDDPAATLVAMPAVSTEKSPVSPVSVTGVPPVSVRRASPPFVMAKVLVIAISVMSAAPKSVPSAPEGDMSPLPMVRPLPRAPITGSTVIPLPLILNV